MKTPVLEVVGIYRGRTYVARLTADGMWVVTCHDGPVFVFPDHRGDRAESVRSEIEHLFQALPEQSPA